MYSISKILRRSGRFSIGHTSFGAVSKLELASGGDGETTFKSSGLVFNTSEGLVRSYSAKDAFLRFVGINKLSSVADSNAKGDEEEKLCKPEETFPVSGDVKEGTEDDFLFDLELGNVVNGSEDVEVGYSNEGKATKKRAPCELYESIVKFRSVGDALDAWLKEGKDLSQDEVCQAVDNLRKHRSYAMCLQLLEYLQAKTQFELTEENYASQVDLVAKVYGLQKAENFVKGIPESFRGELVYRTLLVNCVYKGHVKKAEDLFKKMRELKLATSVYACNQLLLLYSRHDRNKISDVLLLMERENIKPSRGTYKFLINSKGLGGDISGMEKIVETMKEEGIEVDTEIQATLAKFYIRAGHKERAGEVMKEIEAEGLNQTPWVCLSLLHLYSEMGDIDNVRRLSEFVDQNLRFDSCTAAIKAWGKLKEIEEAEAMFERLVEKHKIFPMLPFYALMEIYTENKMLAKGKDLVKRVADGGGKICPSTWHALVKLYIKVGEVGKAELILQKAAKENKMRPMFTSHMLILEEYAKRGDVHNAEKVFLRMKEAGYTAQLVQYEAILVAYLNAKTPAYGISERMNADNVYPNKTLAAKLAQVDPFRKGLQFLI